jgi:hypothetical protein
MQALKLFYRFYPRHVKAIYENQVSHFVKYDVFFFLENRDYLFHKLRKSVKWVEVDVDEFEMLNNVIRDLLLQTLWKQINDLFLVSLGLDGTKTNTREDSKSRLFWSQNHNHSL